MGPTNDLADDEPKSRIDRILQWVPRVLSSKPHVLLLMGLGVYLIVLPILGVRVSSNAELIGGNYTNVTSDIGACIAAGGTLHLVAQGRKRRKVEEERLRLAQETHRLLHYVYGDAARELGHLVVAAAGTGDRQPPVRGPGAGATGSGRRGDRRGPRRRLGGDDGVGVAGQELLRDLGEGVPGRGRAGRPGKGPDDVEAVAWPLAGDVRARRGREGGGERRDVVVLPADEHHAGAGVQHPGGQPGLVPHLVRGADRQLQEVGEALDGLVGPVPGGAFRVAVGGGKKVTRGAQSRPRRAGGGAEQGGERPGALPAARQQAVLVLAAVEVDAVRRARVELVLAVAVRRFCGLLAVADDVDDLRRAAVAAPRTRLLISVPP